MASRESYPVNQLVEHLFRHRSAQLIATLTRFFGVERLDLVEDVVQETLLKALQVWVYRGVPENPSAWILRSAKNRALDILRRESTFRAKQARIAQKIEDELRTPATDEQVVLDGEFKDDQLKMMFACCHPGLSRETRVAMTLKTLCGFSVAEIARAFLSREATIAQRLVRGKRKLRELDLRFEVPGKAEIIARLDSVLDVLYLMFNEGYSVHQGENLTCADLCEETIRLTGLLLEHPACDLPKVHALLAMMLLQASRLPARLDAEGNLLLLKEQNRKDWDQRLLSLGLEHLARSAAGDEISEYHLQAGVAACHAVAPSCDTTDWQRILCYYDQLVELNHSPVVALNRAVALAAVEGPEAAIAEVQKLEKLPPMRKYHLLPATLAELHVQAGNVACAVEYYRQAIDLVGTEPEVRFLRRRLQNCEAMKAGKS